MLWEYGGGADYSAAGSELGQGSFPANPFFYFLWDPVVCELCCSQLLSRVPTLRPPWTSLSPTGSSVLGIIQIRILDWVAISSSRGSSWPGMESSSPASTASKADSLPLAPPARSSIVARESCEQRSLVVWCPQGRTELDKTEATQQQQQQQRHLGNPVVLWGWRL